VRSVRSASADLWRVSLLARAELTRAERTTLDVGSAVVLGMMAVGMQLGRWPLWTGVVAVAGYAAWVIVYSETTMQVASRRATARAPLALTAEPATPPG